MCITSQRSSLRALRLAVLGSERGILRIAATAGRSEYVECKDAKGGISPLKQGGVKSSSGRQMLGRNRLGGQLDVTLHLPLAKRQRLCG
jgi:hypothetical protein